MIKLSELVPDQGVFLDVRADSQRGVLEEITRLLVQVGLVNEEERAGLCQVIAERENVCSTAVGFGVAIPHAYFEKLAKPMVIISRLAEPVDYCSPDDQPVDLIFLLLGPERVPKKHIQILSKIVRMIKDMQFDSELREAKTPAEARQALLEVEGRHH